MGHDKQHSHTRFKRGDAKVMIANGDILLTFLLCCNQVHLFDIDIPGKITFKESDTLTPGEELCVVDTGNTISLSMKFTFLNHANDV